MIKEMLAALICTLLVIGGTAAPSALVDTRTAIFAEELAPLLVADVCYNPPAGIVSYWRPSPTDVPDAGGKLEAFLEQHVPHEKNLEWKWEHYLRQVAGVVIGGRKLVFVSYYHAGPDAAWAQRERERKKELERRGQDYSPAWWRSEPLLVMDGGYRYFRVLYDPESKKFVWHEQNGDA